MKILESTPERYDRGIQILSRGRMDEVYSEISNAVSTVGKLVLDIGCGTGNLSLSCAANGAFVIGIDINAGMLEIARKKLKKSEIRDRVEFREIGIAEIGKTFSDVSFDAVVSCLAFSELTEDEQKYTINTALSILKQGGILMIADETVPERTSRKLLYFLSHIPMKVLAYIWTQSTTRPLKNLEPMIEKAGFSDIVIKRIWNDSFIIIKAKRGKES